MVEVDLSNNEVFNKFFSEDFKDRILSTITEDMNNLLKRYEFKFNTEETRKDIENSIKNYLCKFIPEHQDLISININSDIDRGHIDVSPGNMFTFIFMNFQETIPTKYAYDTEYTFRNLLITKTETDFLIKTLNYE